MNFCYSQVQTGNFSVNPSSFYEDESVTITVSGIDPSIWGVSDVYLWAWYYKNGVQQGDSPNNGTWDNSSEAQKLNANDDGTFSISFVPNDFFDDTEISRMGILVKAKDGTGDKKTQDYLHYVGKVQLTILNPSFNPVTVENGGSISISAEMMSSGSTQAGDFEIYYNENLISSGQGYPRLNQTISNISENGTLKVRGKPFGQSDFGESSIQVYVNPEIEFSAMNANLQDGVNHSNTGNEVTLVLNAPGKEYVYVAGSFNDYTQNENYLMKKDPNSGKFWLKIEGLNNQDLYTYQYWVYDSKNKNGDNYDNLFLSFGLGIQCTQDVAMGDRVSPQGGVKLCGHLGEAYGLLSGFLYDRDNNWGVVYAITGTSNNSDSLGEYSAFFLWEEAILSAVIKAVQ